MITVIYIISFIVIPIITRGLESTHFFIDGPHILETQVWLTLVLCSGPQQNDIIVPLSGQHLWFEVLC